MIRNIVTGRLVDDPALREQAQRGLDGIAGLDLPGMLANHVGHDAGLREGNWSFAIVNDWQDADAYRAYDLDPEHNEYRALVGPGCADICRVQVELSPGPAAPTG